MNSGAAYVYINSIFNTGLVSRPFLIHDLSVVCNKSNTTYATCEAGTTYSFGTHVFTLTLVQCPVLSSFMTYQLFVTRVTRRMPHQEQQLLTLSEHMCSRSVLSVARSVQCFADHCLFPFLLVIVLSILLRFTASGYSFGIFQVLSAYLQSAFHTSRHHGLFVTSTSTYTISIRDFVLLITI